MAAVCYVQRLRCGQVAQALRFVEIGQALPHKMRSQIDDNAGGSANNAELSKVAPRIAKQEATSLNMGNAG
jgi:hypothetical protein